MLYKAVLMFIQPNKNQGQLGLNCLKGNVFAL